MNSIPTLPGITSKMIDTPRLRLHVLFSGPENGTPVLFIHGNAASATFWEESMLKLPSDCRGLAPDLRGYGDTDDKLIDATRGYGDWADDLFGLLDVLGIAHAHVVGHALGGALIFTLVATNPDPFLSATLVDPISPYGFGGSKDSKGTACYPDFAGSGGGMVNPDFPKLIAAGDRSSDNPQASPRVVMSNFYWKPPFRPAREEELLSSLLSQKIGPDKYAGDSALSANWPNVAPGVNGPINASSPKYVGDMVTRFIQTLPKPPILWVRGEEDQIVSDCSLFDLGALGQKGNMSGWPRADVFPPQPMVSHTRAVLDQYTSQDGRYSEVVIPQTGHCPFIEEPDEFAALLEAHFAGR